MKTEHDNVLDAKRSIKKQIAFLESLLQSLKGADKGWRWYGVVTAWCIHRYFGEKLSKDVNEVLSQHTSEEETSHA